MQYYCTSRFCSNRVFHYTGLLILWISTSCLVNLSYYMSVNFNELIKILWFLLIRWVCIIYMQDVEGCIPCVYFTHELYKAWGGYASYCGNQKMRPRHKSLWGKT
jgi:hypothetical protein